MSRQGKGTGTETLVVERLDGSTTFSLRDVCERYGANAEYITEMVAFGIIEPQTGLIPQQWRFSCSALLRIGKALRLQNDLSLNLPGIAMSLELHDEVESLRREVKSLRQQLQRLHLPEA